MFKQARLKRQQLNERLNSFFKFKQGNATVAGALNLSAQKRKKIEDNLNKWSNPYAQTGFDLPHSHDMSMSFRFSQSNFHQQTNKDQQAIRRDLEKEFYETEEPKVETPKKVLRTEEFIEQVPQQPPMSPVLQRFGLVAQIKTSPKKQDPTPVQIKSTPKRESPIAPLENESLERSPSSTEKPAEIIISDKVETQRVETPRLPQLPKEILQPTVQDRSLSIGDSVFNILNDHSMPPVNDQSSIPIVEQQQDMLAQTIKQPLKPREQEILAISRAEEINQAPIEDKRAPPTAPANIVPESKSSVKNESSGLANNSSQGIFFTDDFRDFLDQKHEEEKKQDVPLIVITEVPRSEKELPQQKQPTKKESPKKQIIQQMQIIPSVHEPEPEHHAEESQNPMGDSLTLSVVDRVFNQKIIQHLVLSMQDVASHTPSKQISQKKFKELASQYIEYLKDKHIQEKAKSIIQFRRFVEFQKRIKQGTLYQCFLHFKLFRDYKFNKLRRNIMIDKYRTNKATKHIEKIFKSWKDFTKAHKKWISAFQNQSEQNKIFVAFKHWKMYWFSKRIKKQAVTFRFGTIFQAWRKVAAQTKFQDKKKAMRFFYKSLLRRGFDRLVQGVINSQKQRHNLHLSQNFNYMRLARKYFYAWRDVAEEIIDIKLDRDYIPIEMTVRNRLSSGITGGTMSSVSSNVPSLLQTREISVNIPK